MKNTILRISFALLSACAFGQSASLMPVPRQTFGVCNSALAGGHVYTYAAGTTTPMATFVDYLGVIQNANPIILDVCGRAAAYLGGNDYKIVVTDSNNVQQYTQDHVSNNIFAGSINSIAYNLNGHPLASTDLFDGADVAHYSLTGIFTQPQSLTNVGIFSTLAPHWYLSSIIGNISPASEITPAYTTPLLGAVVAPSGALDLNIMGVTGVVNSQCNSLNETVCNTVGMYANARAGVTGSSTWGANSITWDVPGASATHLTGNEIDVNVFDAPMKVFGLQITGNVAATATIPNNSYAIHINPISLTASGYGYYNGIYFSDGSIGSTAYWHPALKASGTSINGASDGWCFYDSAAASHCLAHLVDSQGIYNVAQGIKITGGAPTCAFTSGGGTSPSCVIDTGSTNQSGIIVATTGTGSPLATGTITLTFTNYSNSFGTNKPVCMYQASDDVGGAWTAPATFRDKTPSVTSDLFTWTNAAVTLSTSTAYRINYHCWPK